VTTFRLRPTALLIVMALFAAATPARAIDHCKVKVDKHTGLILVDASPVGGPLLWGPTSGSETTPFFNDATCNVGGKAKKCQLANPTTLAAKTAPPGCTMYLTDGVTPCSAWIPGCSPGARSGAGALVKDTTGVLIGTALDSAGQGALRKESGSTIRLPVAVDGSGFVSLGGLYYLSTNCTGTPLLLADASMVKPVVVSGTTGYFAASTTSTQMFQSILQFGAVYTDQTQCDYNFGPGNSTYVPPASCCAAFSGSAALGTAQTIDLSIFTAPFQVELQ